MSNLINYSLVYSCPDDMLNNSCLLVFRGLCLVLARLHSAVYKHVSPHIYYNNIQVGLNVENKRPIIHNNNNNC